MRTDSATSISLTRNPMALDKGRAPVLGPGALASLLGCLGLTIVSLDLVGFALHNESSPNTDLGIWITILDLELATKLGAFVLVVCALLMVRLGALDLKNAGAFAYHWFGLSALLSLIAATKVWALYRFALDFIRDVDYRIGIPLTVPAFALVGLVLIAVPYRRFVLALFPPLRNRLIASAGLYIFGLIVLEAVTEHLWNLGGSDFWAYAIVSAFEEVFEMGGAILAMYALLVYGPAMHENLA